MAYLLAREAHRGLSHVLQGQLHERLLPGLLQGVAGFDGCLQGLEQPELVPAGHLWGQSGQRLRDRWGPVTQGVATRESLGVGVPRGLRRPKGEGHSGCTWPFI